MNLTRLPDIRRQLLGLWDGGTILSSVVSGDALFPCRAHALFLHSVLLLMIGAIPASCSSWYICAHMSGMRR